VLGGLLGASKWLPTWLLYDEAGCALYEQITALPEYYLTRAEAEIFAHQSDAILALAGAGGAALAIAELGAGAATKTELVLAAALRRQPECDLLLCDLAPGPVRAAAARIRARFAGARVAVQVGSHPEAGPAIAQLPDRQVLMFLGSSIGNYRDPEAVALLRGMRACLRDGAALVLGTDLLKDPRVIQAAYDDAQGVTAAFTLNVLSRLNREYRCDFRVDGFRHVAVWQEAPAGIEIWIESTRSQRVALGALEREIHFAAGDRIHLETCSKYDPPRVDRLLRAAGLERVGTFLDRAERYAVQVARAVPAPAAPIAHSA
jgi:dimethylhistidine N-methyltransferase